MQACRGSCSDLTNANVSSSIPDVKPSPPPFTKTKPYSATASDRRAAVVAFALDMSMTGICRLGSSPCVCSMLSCIFLNSLYHQKTLSNEWCLRTFMPAGVYRSSARADASARIRFCLPPRNRDCWGHLWFYCCVTAFLPLRWLSRCPCLWPSRPQCEVVSQAPRVIFGSNNADFALRQFRCLTSGQAELGYLKSSISDFLQIVQLELTPCTSWKASDQMNLTSLLWEVLMRLSLLSRNS